MKLEALKAETKFTDCTQLVKFTSSHVIKSVSISVGDARKSKMVRTINLYYNNKPVAELAELRNKWSAWKKAKAVELAPGMTSATVEFPIPLTATNFLIEYAAFYESLQAMALDTLQCPRCNRTVTDKHGICKHCHENAYQCRQCRNINYENLHAFLCNECGFCKYGAFGFSFLAKPSFAPERMENDEDRNRGIENVDKESANAYRRYQQLMSYKKPITRIAFQLGSDSSDALSNSSASSSSSANNANGGGGSTNALLSSSGGGFGFNLSDSTMALGNSASATKVNRKISMLAMLYGKECRVSFESLRRSVQILLGTRRELVRYSTKNKTRDVLLDAKARPANKCFGCANAFVSKCLSLLEHLARMPRARLLLVERGLLQELLRSNLHLGSARARADARNVVTALVTNNDSATQLLNDLLLERMTYAIANQQSLDLASFVHNEMQLLAETWLIEDSGWEARLRLGLRLFFHALQHNAQSPVVSEQIILPCLRHIVRLCELGKSQRSSFLLVRCCRRCRRLDWWLGASRTQATEFALVAPSRRRRRWWCHVAAAAATPAAAWWLAFHSGQPHGSRLWWRQWWPSSRR